MSELASMECVPCKGGVPPLAGDELNQMMDRLGGGWQVRAETGILPEAVLEDMGNRTDWGDLLQTDTPEGVDAAGSDKLLNKPDW